MTRTEDDAGAATPLAAVLVLVLIALLSVVVQAGSALAARHRAEGAADLAALAAAAHSAIGAERACGKASVVTAAMGVGVVSCTATGDSTWIRVRAPVPGLASVPGLAEVPGVGEVTARARAGPVGDVEARARRADPRPVVPVGSAGRAVVRIRSSAPG